MTNPIYDATYVRTQRVSIPNGLATGYLIRAISRELSPPPGLYTVDTGTSGNLDYRVIRGKQLSSKPDVEIELLLHIVPVLTQEQVNQLKKGKLDFVKYPFKEFDLNLTQEGAEVISPELVEKVRSEFQGPRRLLNLALYHAEDYVRKLSG